MHLAATLTTAGLCGLIYIVLSIRVVQVRGALKISLGDGGHDSLLTRIRSHANFAEYVPLLLVLLAVVELSIDSSPWLWVLGLTVVAARVSHAIGMAIGNANPFRVAGMIGTWVPLVVLSVWALLRGLGV